MAELPAIGIDLGTTFSAVAVVNGQGQPEIVPNAESERLTPSAVFFDDDAIIVGQIAKDASTTSPDQVIQFVKRQMGNTSWHFAHDGKRYSAADVSAILLTRLKTDAEKQLGRSLPYAVITVPAYFDDERRRATMAAGELAGLKVLDLLNEPTAAAIAFGVDRSSHPETVLVYDLGGGTFDVTVMHVNGKDIRILATDGDHQLGGKDFDDAVIRLAVERFSAEHGFDPTLEPFAAAEIRAAAEKAKRELSKRNKTLLMVRAQGRSARVEIEREHFEALIQPKLDTTLALVRSVLRDAQLEQTQIDRVLLIGGSTRVPAVTQVLTAHFGKPPEHAINPDEAVALGAALMAAHKLVGLTPDAVPAPVADKVGGLQITDVTSHSFGIEAFVPGTDRRINRILIPRNSPIPTQVSREFVTNVPGQTAIRVTIYQGEFEDPALCNPIGDFTLSGLPANRPAGRKVRLTVSCDDNGVINVAAQDIETGLQTSTQVSYKSDPNPGRRSARDRWAGEKPIV